MSKNTNLLLRIALAFAFLYPPVSAFFNPFAWVGYFPEFLGSLPVDTFVLLHVFGVLEVVLALWILSGKKIFIPSILSAILLAGIVVFNFPQMDVLFRDISILLIAVALALDAKKNSG